MSIFRRRQEEEAAALSDAALLAAAEAAAAETAAETAAAEAAAGESAAADAAAETAPETAETAEAAPSLQQLQQQEAAWQQALAEALPHWPQLCAAPRALLAKMSEISARYGDARLWQRAPAAILREAAIELYGLPAAPAAGAIRAAVEQAHAAGMRRAAECDRSKLGLAPPRSARRAPAAISEEERIIREMTAARRGGIF